MINTTSKSTIICDFFEKMEKYHLGIIEFFNIYREFLFDNLSLIYNLTSLEYLIKYEKEDLLDIYENINYLNLSSDLFLFQND